MISHIFFLYFVCNVNNGKNEANVQYIVDFCYLNINNLGYINEKGLIESQPYSRKLQIHKMPNIDRLIGLYMLNLTEYVAYLLILSSYMHI